MLKRLIEILALALMAAGCGAQVGGDEGEGEELEQSFQHAAAL